MPEPEAVPEPTAATSSYWQQRQQMMYYRYIDVLVRAMAADARSMIDVGSSNTPVIEWFDWIHRRDALDLREPYASENVRGIKANFITYVPEERYDFATCLQVLEHVPDVTPFARHLLEVAESVLVSVPFMWPKGRTVSHVHDPVSLENLIDWMGREPQYHVLVTEPLSSVTRLIAYFHSPSSKFSMKAARERLFSAQGAVGVRP